ncbi:tandem-95 repeat protein [Microbacterium sp. W4I4]|uniref:tandem-95 repeat protein n=1 Tax=Microbacterium sp. W4I4 TaxID=3042295 RepID=UPI00358FA3A3
MTYTPDPDFTGVDRFTYFVTNDPIDGATTPVDAFIDVAQVVDAPSVTNDTATIDEDTPTTVDVAANDTDGDGDLRPASVVEDPCDAHLCAPVGRDLYLHGEWTVNDDGTVTYTPERDYVGEAIFLYRISDALGQFGFGRVTVTVQASDAMDDGFDAVEDQLLSVAAPGVLGNDDPAAAGDNPIVTVPAEHGQVVMATDGSFTYLPGDDFAGKDQFTYEAGDDPATVTLDVAAVNDAPVVHLNPYCDPSQPLVLCLGDLDDRDLLEGEAAELRGSIADAEFDVGTYVIEWGDGSQSTGSYPCSGEGCPFEYFPTFNSGLCIPLSSCAGPLFFAFEHSYGDDPTGSAAYFPITMTVTEGDGTTSAGVSSARVLNSPPTMTLAPDCGAAEGSICLGDYSILAGQPGDLLRVGGKVDDIGRDVGTVTIDWGDGSEDTVIPTGCDDADSTCATPSERDFGCAATLTAPPSCGYFAGTHAYASGGDYIITVVADDGDGGVDQETATATVTHANGAPDASDGNVVTREDTAITVDLADLVTDGETADADLGYEVIVDPTAGTVTLAGSVATYVPSADANGVDSFEYRVTDRGAPDDCGEPSDDCSGSLGAMATIGVTVTAVNDAPSFTGGQNIHAVGDGVAVSEPGWATGISTGPADEASQTVEFVVDTEDSELFTADGQPAISADGTLTFTPAAGGIAELSVTAVDSGPATAPDDNSSEPQALTISIVPPNRAPVLISPDEPTGSYSDFLSFIVSASDPEDGLSGVTIEVEALPSGLTATGTAEQMTISGVLTAEPATYPVILRACDALHACSETVLNIVVQPEAMAVKLASSTPSAVPADASGVAPPITFSAKLIEDKDGRWGDLTRIQSSDLSGTLTSVVTGFETTCAPRIVKTTAARGNAPGTLELTCTFATGVPVGVYDVAFSVGGWFAGGASAALTVTATPVPGDTVTGAGSVALPGGGTGDFTFSVAPSGKKAVTGTWTYAERDAGAVVIRSVNATSITSFAVTGSGASRTVVITGKAQVDGIGGYDFRVTAIDGGGASDAYGQSVTGAKKAAAPPLSFTPLPLASGDIALQ